MFPTQLLKGTFQTIILKLLAERGRLYGYELTQLVEELSENQISFPPGSLYPMLHKMEEEGLVTGDTVEYGKRTRKYYTITPRGEAESRNKIEEFLEFARTMIQILRPQTTS